MRRQLSPRDDEHYCSSKGLDWIQLQISHCNFVNQEAQEKPEAEQNPKTYWEGVKIKNENHFTKTEVELHVACQKAVHTEQMCNPNETSAQPDEHPTSKHGQNDIPGSKANEGSEETAHGRETL